MINYFVAAWFYLAGCMMAWSHYPAMLAVEELELETGDMQYLVHTKKLVTCVVLWPVVEVLNAGYEFYLNYIKKGDKDVR